MLLLLIASLLIYRKQAVYSGLYPMICKTNLNEKKKILSLPTGRLGKSFGSLDCFLAQLISELWSCNVV